MSRTNKRLLKKKTVSLDELVTGTKIVFNIIEKKHKYITDLSEELKGHQRVIPYLLKSAQITSLSAIHLVSRKQPYDAAILLRSVMEINLTLLRIAMSKNPIEAEREFFVDYYEALLAHEASKTQAAHELSTDSTIGGNWNRPLVTLEEIPSDIPEHFEEARRKWPRSKRIPFIKSWSASEILNEASKDPRLEGVCTVFRSLYAGFSHLSHSDPCGVRIRFAGRMYGDRGSTLHELRSGANALSATIELSRIRSSILGWFIHGEEFGKLIQKPSRMIDISHKFSLVEMMNSMEEQQVHLKYNKSQWKERLDVLMKAALKE